VVEIIWVRMTSGCFLEDDYGRVNSGRGLLRGKLVALGGFVWGSVSAGKFFRPPYRNSLLGAALATGAQPASILLCKTLHSLMASVRRLGLTTNLGLRHYLCCGGSLTWGFFAGES